MKLLVTQIEFDVAQENCEEFGSITGAIEYERKQQLELQTAAIGIWEVDSYSALKPKIERTLGHKISTIEYTANLIHPLTSYL